MNTQQIIETYGTHVMPTYARNPVAFVRGEGATLYDPEGKAYIDFASGIGVNSIGYAHPQWVAAVSEQAGTLAHVSNLYYTEPGGTLAERLCRLSGMRNVFFANSGAEANEGVIKLARKYSFDKYGKGRATILTLRQSFHGRTITTLAATGQDVFHDYFFPFTEGFRYCPPGDLAALEGEGGDVCGILLEVVQGEGGVNPLDDGYLKAVQALCHERDWLLLIDEVQTGIGRCGDWFAFQGVGLCPDVVSFAKGIAGGLPLGGFLAGEKVCQVLGPRTHATTFGGNPICCAAAHVVLDVLGNELPKVAVKGDKIRQAILDMSLPQIAAVRGRGLMLAPVIQGDTSPGVWSGRLLDAGLVTLTAGSDALRFLPPLTISDAEIDKGLAIFRAVMAG